MAAARAGTARTQVLAQLYQFSPGEVRRDEGCDPRGNAGPGHSLARSAGLSGLRPHQYRHTARNGTGSCRPGANDLSKKAAIGSIQVRKATNHTATTETDIRLVLTIEGRGRYEVVTGIRFLDHMLELFARHGAFDLTLHAKGDLDVDQHHTVEDVGIALGEAFRNALGDKRGIMRAGYFLMTMDETLGLAAVDFSGRAAAVVNTKVSVRLVG